MNENPLSPPCCFPLVYEWDLDVKEGPIHTLPGRVAVHLTNFQVGKMRSHVLTAGQQKLYKMNV